MATINETLTALANSIRTKSGATGTLTLDEMKAAVDSITTGGGGSLPPSIRKIVGGSFILPTATEARYYPVSHNLGEQPKWCIIWTSERDNQPYNTIKAFAFLYLGFNDETDSYIGNSQLFYWSGGGWVNSSRDYQKETWYNTNITNTQITVPERRPFGANLTYNWIAWC